MTERKSKFIWLLLRIGIAAVFIYAGAVKIANPAGFAEQVDNYRILPYFWVTIVAIVFPWLELINGVLLLFNRWVSASAFILLVMDFIFIMAIALAMARGLDISCGCFSVEGEGTKIGILKLTENIFLFAIIFMIFKNYIKNSYQ